MPQGILLVILILFACRERPAQNAPAAAAVETIAPPAGLVWGMGVDKIERRFGPPALVTDVLPSVHGLAYPDTLFGESAQRLLFVHDEGRLIEAGYLVFVEPGPGCEDKYMRIQSAIGGLYRQIQPKDERLYESSLAFCLALQVGEASWKTIWEDPKSQAVIYMAYSEKADQIKVLYQGPEYDHWMADARRKIPKDEEKF